MAAHAGWTLLLLIVPEKGEACESSCQADSPGVYIVKQVSERECVGASAYPKRIGLFFSFSEAYTANRGTKRRRMGFNGGAKRSNP